MAFNPYKTTPDGQVVARMEYHRFVHRRSWRAVQLSDKIRHILFRREIRTEYLKSEKVWGERASRVTSDCHFRKTATEYDRKPGIKWLRCTAK
jgi:hypothetical protein